MPESGTYFRPAGLPGIEALHASFIEHAYRPHSHPTWTVAVIERGAARFEVDDTRQRADEGELFVLEPEAVHTGMAAVPEGWTYKVLYVAPDLLAEWADRVSLAELSTVAGLSRFELVRRFRADTGMPPHAFQIDLRIGRARRMLAAGEAPAAVAASCGFADQAHLTRTFRRSVGVTPARFARA